MSESQLLAKQENEDNNKANQEAIVLKAIKERPSVSTYELAKEIIGLPLYTVSARLRGLEKQGLIKKSGKKMNNGRHYSTYVVIESHEEQMARVKAMEKAERVKIAYRFIEKCKPFLSKHTIESVIFEVKAFEAA